MKRSKCPQNPGALTEQSFQSLDFKLFKNESGKSCLAEFCGSRRMPLLRKQPFVKSQPPAGLKPEDEVFFCETTKEVFQDYEAFFERTILCNSLVWSCSVTGKGNLTYEEAAESEKKSRKKISNLPKGLKRGLLYLVSRCSTVFTYNLFWQHKSSHIANLPTTKAILFKIDN